VIVEKKFVFTGIVNDRRLHTIYWLLEGGCRNKRGKML
jgi:hypothetical protein